MDNVENLGEITMTYKYRGHLANAIKRLNGKDPKHPLTGRGYRRLEITKETLDILKRVLYIHEGYRPNEFYCNHVVTVYSRAIGKHGKSTPTYYISPELSMLIARNCKLFKYVGLSRKDYEAMIREEIIDAI